jgi:hypothetical protein
MVIVYNSPEANSENGDFNVLLTDILGINL